MNEIIIDDKLPSLNEYTRACRTHWSHGYKMKQDVEQVIWWAIRKAKLNKTAAPVKHYPVELHIEWVEKTKRRDVDNIQSAQKFILDALKESGIIRDDARKYVSQIHHKITDGKEDRVIVRWEDGSV